LRALERLYRRRVPAGDITTPELTRSLAAVSLETRRQVGVLVHRSGQVESVIVGDASRLMLPDVGRLRAAEGRFRGIRLIHTHLRGEPLTRDDLVDLVRLRLDLVAAIQLGPGGEPRSLCWAHNVPADDGGATYREIGPIPFGQPQAHVDVAGLMAGLETEFSRRARAREVAAKDGRAILVHVGDRSGGPGALGEAEESLRELRELARTAGVEVIDALIQMRDHVDPKHVMGKGKLEEVVMRAIELDAAVLVVDHELSPAQASAIAKQTDLKVIDRTQLILDIFAQRAESRDGKLQVELAQLKYAMPRLAQKDDSLSRLTGGIGGRGPGETVLEIGRRRAKERVTHLEHQLKQLGKQREQRRRKRTREGVPTVAIVGYTNAGKSTLLNTMTGADVLAEDRLFATLDTRSRILRCGWAGWGEREVVITDTVGFIRSLPKDLFAAFRATFEEAADADLLLHVIDASDPASDDHVRTVVKVLDALDLSELPRLSVYNKIDALGPLQLRALRRVHPEAEFVSANQRETTRPLIERVARELAGKWQASAKGPNVEPARDAGAAAPPARSANEETTHVEEPDARDQVTTIAEMLRAGGKRVRHPARRDHRSP
jgi:GTP-binding protein HflX